MSAARRQKVQIYADVLRAIHFTAKNGDPLVLYRIERLAGLTHTRLRESLEELREAGLIDESFRITSQGYAFLSELSNKVEPVMLKYGLWRGSSATPPSHS